MPLRDHFRPPLDNKHSWDELHGQWPAMMALKLFDILPDGYVAAPGVHLGAAFEIDVSAYEHDESAAAAHPATEGVATWTAPPPRSRSRPTCPNRTSTRCGCTTPTGGGGWWPSSSWSARRTRTGRRAGERSWPRSRPCSIMTCACRSWTWSRCGSSTCTRTCWNSSGSRTRRWGPSPRTCTRRPSAAGSGRKRHRKRSLLETWFYPLALDRPLPTLPIWLDDDLGVLLDLEASYEDTCRVLRIP